MKNEIIVDPAQLGYGPDWAKNVPEGRKVRVGDDHRLPENAIVIATGGDLIPPRVHGTSHKMTYLYFLPEDDPVEVYDKPLSELPPPPQGLELCSETPTKDKPEGATHSLSIHHLSAPGWVEYPHRRSLEYRLWARPIPPPKKRYLKVPLDGVSFVSSVRRGMSCFSYFENNPMNGAEIVEE